MAGRAEKMYGKSPTLTRGEGGEMEVGKPSETKKHNAGADKTLADAKSGMDTMHRHSYERREHAHRRIREHMELHAKHEMEHAHHEEKHGMSGKETMHERHEKEMQAMHDRHVAEMKSMHDRQEAEKPEGAPEPEEQGE